MYENLPQTIMSDENNHRQTIERPNTEMDLAKNRGALAQTLKSPPSTSKTTGGRKVGVAAFNSNSGGIPKRPHSGANPRQSRENSNAPPPNAK